MPAADYRKRSDERLEKARVKMEEFIADKQMPKDKADAIRAEFTSGVTQIRAKIEQACADGTVTQDEADAVRSLSRSLLKHATGH